MYYKKLLEKIQFLENQNNKLFELAYYDNLTKVYNRNWLRENFIKVNDEFKLILVDVNGLKAINDCKGHLEGDKYLLEVVNILKKYGSVVRYGGDEFILIASKDFDESVLNDIRYCYGCSLKSSGEQFETAFERADSELYQKKKECDTNRN